MALVRYTGRRGYGAHHMPRPRPGYQSGPRSRPWPLARNDFTVLRAMEHLAWGSQAPTEALIHGQVAGFTVPCAQFSWLVALASWHRRGVPPVWNLARGAAPPPNCRLSFEQPVKSPTQRPQSTDADPDQSSGHVSVPPAQAYHGF